MYSSYISTCVKYNITFLDRFSGIYIYRTCEINSTYLEGINKKQNSTKELCTICDTYNLSQQIQKVTRIDLNTGKGTLIDHIWTTPSIKILSSGTCQGISDHLGTFIKLNKSNINAKSKPPVKLKRNYKKYDPQKFCNDTAKALSESQIEKLLEEKNLDQATEELITVITDTAKIHAPLYINKNQKSTTFIPWMTEELAKEVTQKNELLCQQRPSFER